MFVCMYVCIYEWYVCMDGMYGMHGMHGMVWDGMWWDVWYGMYGMYARMYVCIAPDNYLEHRFGNFSVGRTLYLEHVRRIGGRMF